MHISFFVDLMHEFITLFMIAKCLYCETTFESALIVLYVNKIVQSFVLVKQ